MSQFNKLKAKSIGTSEIARLLSAMDVTAGKHLAAKVDDALRSIKAHSLATQIRDCRRGAVCSSIYCLKCRAKAVGRLEERYWRNFQEQLGGDEEQLQMRWHYLTVLCALTDVDVKAVSAAVDEARIVLKKLVRKYKGVSVVGAFEFELVDLDDLRVMEGDASIKKQTLFWMMDGDVSRFRAIKVLVHYHAILDTGDLFHDAREVRTWFGKQYDKHARQVELKITRQDQDVLEKIHKIASYAFKSRLRYNTSFSTRGYEVGPHFKNKDAGRLIRLYQKFIDGRAGSYKSLLINVG